MLLLHARTVFGRCVNFLRCDMSHWRQP